ncbi:MAG: hypothetical protein ACRDV9_00265 [Acidimicrobiia bacterium]
MGWLVRGRLMTLEILGYLALSLRLTLQQHPDVPILALMGSPKSRQ